MVNKILCALSIIVVFLTVFFLVGSIQNCSEKTTEEAQEYKAERREEVASNCGSFLDNDFSDEIAIIRAVVAYSKCVENYQMFFTEKNATAVRAYYIRTGGE